MPSASSLTLEVFRAENRLSTSVCGFTAFLAGLSARDRETLKAVIADPTIQAAAIVRVLKPRGYPFTYQVITRHRRHGCTTCGIAAL